MDYQRHPAEPRPQPQAQAPLNQNNYQNTAPPKKAKSGKGMKFLLILLLLAAAAGGAYYWQEQEAKKTAKAQQAEVAALKMQVANLQNAVNEAKNAALDKEAEPKQPPQATLDNIEAAVKSGNYAALEGLMASKVNVILAASQGVGMRTPAQAVSDIKYLDSGNDPWDFDLSAATITDYQTGDYKKYFPATAHVGKSANDYVVSFQFDADSKISGIFMTASASLL